MEGREGLVEACGASFRSRFGADPEVLAWAPGRINVIGEHTDYNSGLTLPGAVDRWAVCALGEGEPGRWEVWSEDFGSGALLSPDTSDPSEPPWTRLVRGVLEIVRVGGLRLAIRSTVPVGGGLSSSAAVCMAILSGLREHFGIPLTGRELIHLAREVEHRRAGAPTGLMDQYASWYGREGRVLLLDLRTLQHRPVPGQAPGHTWVVADTGVQRALSETAYGERVAETRRGLEAVRRADPSVVGFRDLEPEHLRLLTDPTTRDRLRHYLEENRRVRAAVRALEAGDTEELGSLLDASHASLRDLYEVSSPELDLLAGTARAHPACRGARMMGGGFGGCTLNLVADEGRQGFLRALAEKAFPVHLADGAGVRRP